MLLKAFFCSILVFLSTEFDIKVYKRALDHIKSSPEYIAIRKGKNNFFISDELIRFHSMGWYFKKELRKYIEVDEGERVLRQTEVGSKNDELLSLGAKKCAKLKIYFSDVRDGIFFCELIESPKNAIKYADRPDFGKSYAFMFKVENGEVKLLSTKEIAYN